VNGAGILLFLSFLYAKKKSYGLNKRIGKSNKELKFQMSICSS